MKATSASDDTRSNTAFCEPAIARFVPRNIESAVGRKVGRNVLDWPFLQNRRFEQIYIAGDGDDKALDTQQGSSRLSKKRVNVLPRAGQPEGLF